MPEKTVRFVNVTGQEAVHVFVDGNGAEHDVPCPMEEYAGLGRVGANGPTPPEGMTWKFSAVRAAFDVPIQENDVLMKNGSALYFYDSDPYRGKMILLDQITYEPVKVDATTLSTKTAVPTKPSGNVEVVAVKK